ncbi:hypothetical protein G7Y89_g2717 [Cudoniella acicularis]|uniref:Uncharacterized protein n=1 Tax=Cudoniella acicularis TaxID=354080 RepID=A0A8H4RSU0_9HELO|nr:hypothetical protein G7Y89_g2717 [Cudoniella acicularis]
MQEWNEQIEIESTTNRMPASPKDLVLSLIAASRRTQPEKMIEQPEEQAAVDISCESHSSNSFKNVTFRACVLYRCDLSNCQLLNCEITQSTLSNSTLHDSDIKKSILLKSKLHHCRCKDEDYDFHVDIDSPIFRSFFRDCSIEDTGIWNSKIHRSSIVAGGVENCHVTTSNLTSVIMDYCEAYTCSFASGMVNSSYLQEYKADDNTQVHDCEVMKCSLAFRKFPAEIRIPIFHQAMSWSKRVPALIVALRGDQKLYHEALEYYSKTPFTLDVTREGWHYHWHKSIKCRLGETPRWIYMPAGLFVKVEKLTIDCVDQNLHERLVEIYVQAPKTLRELEIRYFSLIWWSEIWVAASRAMTSLSSLEKFTLTWATKPALPNEPAWKQLYPGTLIRGIAYATQRNGEPVRDRKNIVVPDEKSIIKVVNENGVFVVKEELEGTRFGIVTSWIWQAEKGKTLKWVDVDEEGISWNGRLY